MHPGPAEADHRPDPVSPALTVTLLAIAWMIVNTQRYTAASFVGASSIMADFGITASAAGLLASAYFPAYGALQIPMGLVVDRARPRLILFLAVALVAASNVLFALAPAVEWAVLARVAVGVSSAPVFLCCLKIISELSLREYPRRVGLIVTISTLGAMLALTGLPLLMALFPWRVVALLLAAELALLLPLLALAPLPRPSTGQRTAAGELLGVIVEQLRSAAFWWITLPAMAWCGAYFGLLTWLPRYARDVLQTSTALTGLLPGLFQVGLLVGAFLFGWLQTRHRRLGPWFLYGGGAVFTLAVATLPTLYGLGASSLLYLLAPILGLVFGAFFCIFSLVSEIVPHHKLGTVTGLVNALTFLPSFVDPWLVGALLDRVDRPQAADPTYSAAAYTAGFVFLATTMAVGLLGGALFSRLRTRTARASAALEAS